MSRIRRSRRSGHRSPVVTILLKTQFPAATKGSIHADEVESDVARRNRQLVLLLDLRGFQVKNSIEIDGAGAVLLDPKVGGRRCRLDAAVKVVGLLARSQEAPERRLDFPAGRQNRVLIGRNQLLRLGDLQRTLFLIRP